MADWSWTDDSALYQLRYPDSERGDSAERYLKARLQGWDREQANGIINGKVSVA